MKWVSGDRERLVMLATLRRVSIGLASSGDTWMSAQMRNLGIDAVGGKPWGTHFCLFYRTAEEERDATVRYLRQGLRDHEYCMWVTSESFPVAEARSAILAAAPDLSECMSAGQIEILTDRSWYLRDGHFDANRVLRAWLEKERHALNRGHAGLRVAGNGSWLFENEWRLMSDYEGAINRSLDSHRILAMCCCPLGVCDALQTFDIIRDHHFALVRRGQGWEVIQSATDRKIAERFHQSETQYRRLFENSLDGIFVTSAEGAIIDANPAACFMLGMTKAEMLDASLSQVISADDPQLPGFLLELDLIGKVHCELTFVRKDGTRFLGDATTVFLDRGTKSSDAVTIVRDVSERKLAEDALRRSNERLDLAKRAAGAGIWDWSIVTGGIDWSSEMFALFGIDESRMPASFVTWESVLHPDDRVAAKENINQAIRDGNQLINEYRVIRPDGEVRWIQALGRTTYDDQRQPLRMTGVCIDVTERKRAEQERLAMERRLLHSQKLESLGLLAGGIAHDFNNILAGIMGYADLASLKLAPTEPASSDIEVVRTAVQRAAELTRQLLAYSGRGKFVVEPVNLSLVVNEMRPMLGVSVNKKAALEYQLAADDPAVRADATQIRQLLLNLVINASESLGGEPGLITVSTSVANYASSQLAEFSTEDGLRPGTYVRLEVTDTGCGMDGQTLDRIFDPFFTTKFTGRGLGLAAVHGIVRGHHGAIRVVSRRGEGTRFQLLFPACGVSINACETTHEPLQLRGSGTVLLVDDEDLVRSASRDVLRQAGFVVLTASDGETAVRIFRRHRQEIVCVLLDHMMPAMGGDETYRALCAIDPLVRVLLCSGYSEDDVTAGFPISDRLGFIQKPYRADRLVAAVLSLAGQTESATVSAESVDLVADPPPSASGRSGASSDLQKPGDSQAPARPTVLIVDDDEIARMATQALFEQAEFSVVTASGGEEAVRAYADHQEEIACLFLDLTLPDMDGEETLRELRRAGASAPAVITSGCEVDELTGRFTGLDVLAFVQKPDPIDGVIARLRQVLRSA